MKIEIENGLIKNINERIIRSSKITFNPLGIFTDDKFKFEIELKDVKIIFYSNDSFFAKYQKEIILGNKKLIDTLTPTCSGSLSKVRDLYFKIEIKKKRSKK